MSATNCVQGSADQDARWRQSRWLRSRSCDDMELVAHNPRELPDGLPIPEDDGAGAHLLGLRVPHIRLMATDGRQRDIADLSSGPVVIYVYPRTGVPGVEMPEGWDLIPGARGCTPQACAYRDDHAAFEATGVGVLGLSTQDIKAQREFAEREHIPFPLLSDPDVRVGRSLRLPTFQAGGDELYKRLTLVIGDGKVVYARYPVFPPDGDAAVTLAWLRSSRLR